MTVFILGNVIRTRVSQNNFVYFWRQTCKSRQGCVKNASRFTLTFKHTLEFENSLIIKFIFWHFSQSEKHEPHCAISERIQWNTKLDFLNLEMELPLISTSLQNKIRKYISTCRNLWAPKWARWWLTVEAPTIKAGLSPSKKKIFFYLLQWKPFKNDKKYFLFYLESSFRSQDI